MTTKNVSSSRKFGWKLNRKHHAKHLKTINSVANSLCGVGSRKIGNSWFQIIKLNYCPIVFVHFSRIWRMQDIWSVTLLHRNPDQRFPIVSSTYGIQLQRKILESILYVLG